MCDNNTASISAINKTLSLDTVERRLLSSIRNSKPRSLILLISPLLGEKVAMLQKHIPRGSQLVCICLNEVHKKEYETNETLLDNFKSTPLLFKDNCETVLCAFIHQEYFQYCCILYYSKEAYFYKKEADALQFKCSVEIKQSWTNHTTLAYFGNKWFLNIWNNLQQAYIGAVPDVSTAHILENKSVQKSVIVVGAGPSLKQEHLSFIIKHRNALIIFAVDTALPILQKCDIIPDFCILLESQYYNMNDLLPAPHKDIIALADISCYPASIRAFSKAVCFSSHFANISFFQRYKNMLPPQIPPLGSVGLMAIYLAIQSNAQNLFLIGLDFSFYKGLSHAIHSPAYIQWQCTQSRMQPWGYADAHFNSPTIKNIDKSNRIHTATLEMYRKKVEQSLIPMAKKYGVQCFDLNTESVIQSMDTITIQQAESLLKKSFFGTHDAGFNNDPDNNRLSYRWRDSIEFHNGTRYFATLDELQEYYLHKNTHIYQSIFTSELQICRDIQKRLRVLEKNNEIPTEADWDAGMDSYAISLGEDPYLIKHDANIWKKNNIHTRLHIIVQKMIQEISQCKL